MLYLKFNNMKIILRYIIDIKFIKDKILLEKLNDKFKDFKLTRIQNKNQRLFFYKIIIDI